MSWPYMHNYEMSSQFSRHFGGMCQKASLTHTHTHTPLVINHPARYLK